MSRYSLLPEQSSPRALQIYEVVHHILSLTKEDSGSWTLAQCARVNRAFSEPALDILWNGHGMSLVKPLLFPLSNVTKKRPVRGAFKCGCMKWVRKPSPKQWDRLQYYAQKVRHLLLDEDSWFQDGSLDGLFTHLAGRPLFPGLISISWRQYFALSRDFFSFLSPSLQRIEIEIGHHLTYETKILAYRIQSLLEDVGARIPQVSSLVLKGIECPATIEALLQVKTLRTVNLQDCVVSASLVHACARMENLTECELHLRGVSVHDLIGCAGFARLQCFRAKGTISTLMQALKCVTSTVLRQIVLTPQSDRVSGPAEARALLEYIAGAQFAPTLRRVEILNPNVTRCLLQNMVPPAAVMDVLEPLLGLCDLEVVAFDFHAEKLTVAGVDFRRMASAWPKLVQLSMLYDSKLSEVSVTVLAEFAAQCPSLQSIRLPLLRHMHAPLALTPTPAHRLQSLHMWGNKIPPTDDVTILTPYITRLFLLLKAEWKDNPEGGLSLTV